MTYEEYTQLDRDAQVRACVNDLALVAATQRPVSGVDDLAEAPETESLFLTTGYGTTKADRHIGARYVVGRYKAVALQTGTEESTVRRVLEAYEEFEARRRT